MKKWNILLAAGMLIFSCAGCGRQEVEIVTPTEKETVNEAQAESEQTEAEVEEKNDN